MEKALCKICQTNPADAIDGFCSICSADLLEDHRRKEEARSLTVQEVIEKLQALNAPNLELRIFEEERCYFQRVKDVQINSGKLWSSENDFVSFVIKERS